MKIQIDTDNKTITIEEDILLTSFIDNLNSMFPNKEWKSFTLKTNVINNWNQPYIIPMIPTYPTYPWVTYETGSGDLIDTRTFNYNSGTYNIEFK